MEPNQYIDLDLTFNIHPVKGDISKLINEAAVKQALKNLVYTSFMERPFQPNFGCGVYLLLFENMTPATTLAIDKNIRQSIANYEPRVRLNQLDVIPLYEQNAYRINIIFTILDRENPTQLDIIMKRLR